MFHVIKINKPWLGFSISSLNIFLSHLLKSFNIVYMRTISKALEIFSSMKTPCLLNYLIKASFLSFGMRSEENGHRLRNFKGEVKSLRYNELSCTCL